MSRELRKTLTFVGAAAVLLISAVVFLRPRVTTAEAFSDQGQPFFPEFKDPQLATTLEVIDYDPSTAAASPFKVSFEKDKGWVIPSHNDYPADGKDRLAKTAAGVIDLKKDVIFSDSAEDHEKLGVVDPLDTKSTSLTGRGKRVTLKDAKGQVLADLIVGKPVPGRTNQRYVRVPGQKRTYGVNIDVDLSARFADWIETNLLKLDSGRIVRITIDNHKVDPEQGTVTAGDVVTIERKDTTSPWTMEEIPSGRELDTSKVSTMTSALADLKIVGVRPKPAGLTAELKALASKDGQASLSRQSIQSLQARGFYLTRDGRLLSNQGDIYIATDEGIVYVLRFGEVTFASGEALTAGSDDEGTPEPGKDEAAKKAQGSGDNRYLFVTAQFETELVPRPGPAKVGMDGELPAEPFQRTEAERKEAEEKAKRDAEDYARKIADGQKKAKELTDRFAGWYYVVPGDAFRQIVVDRAALTREPQPAGADANTSSTGGTSPFSLPSGGSASPFPPGH